MKKNKLKKIGMLLFVLVAVFTINLSLAKIYAANITITTSDTDTLADDTAYKRVTNKGSFDVKHSSDNEIGEKMRVYKIVDVYYNSTLDSLKYQFTTEFKTFLASNDKYKTLTVDDYFKLEKGSAVQSEGRTERYWEATDVVVSGGHLSSNDFAKLMSSYATYIRTHSDISGIALTTTFAASATAFSSAELEVGSYLALPESTKYVYAVMVDSIQLEKKDNQWSIKDAKVDAKMSDSNISLTYKYGTSIGNDISVDLDKTIETTVAAVVPTYPADSTTTGEMLIKLPDAIAGFSITFTTANGEKTVTVNKGEEITDNSDVVIGRTTTKHEGEFEVPTGDIYLNPKLLVGGSTVTITYSKSLSSSKEDLVLGSPGNQETVTMTYPDPYGTNTLNDSGSGILRTYGLQIIGTSGAEFDVKKDGTRIGIVVIGKDGTGEIKGLAFGDYVVEQSAAPGGYIQIKDPKTVKVGSGTEVEGKPGYYGVTMVNTIPALLPFTGSTGTIIFTIFGALVVIIAIVSIMYYNKKKKKRLSLNN